MTKKNILKRALDETKEDSIVKLKDFVKDNCAVIFSQSEAFDLAAVLSENKNPIGAKSGQEALEDIEVEEGVTELIPGPAISELGALGIKVSVENGKIAIKQTKVIVKKGQKITSGAAMVMQKLDIKPFLIGIDPLAIYDSESKKIYTNVKIDREKTLLELKTGKVKSLGFAQSIIFYCKETVGYFLAKAEIGAKKIGTLSPNEQKSESEEKKEDIQIQEENKTQEGK